MTLPPPVVSYQCPGGRLNWDGNRPWTSLPAGNGICPAPWLPAGRFASAGFSLPFFLSCPPALPFSYCISVISSLMARENSSELHVPSHKYVYAFPEFFSCPFLPLTHVGSAMQRTLLSSRHQCQRLSLTISFNAPAATEAYPLPVQFSPS